MNTFLFISLALVQAHSSTIHLIRHGEKKWSGGCLNDEGKARASNLPNIFSPDSLYANYYDDIINCERCHETLEPIAALTGLDIVFDYGYPKKIGGNDAGAKAMLQELDASDAEHVILVAWEHNNIAPLALALGAAEADVPSDWASSDFDSIYELTFEGTAVTKFEHKQQNFPQGLDIDVGVTAETERKTETETETETMVVCKNCTKTEGCSSDEESSRTFHITPGECVSPLKEFPDDLDLWGENDFLDVCEKRVVVRTFYSSNDGSCAVVTDSFRLEFGVCLGPFGPDTPWGTFKCE